MAVTRRRFLLGLLMLAAAMPVAAQRTVEYVNTGSGANQLALGYPVPQPVASLTPVNGFRAYEQLHARHQALALEHDFVSAHQVGSSIKGVPIYAYTISDPDNRTAAGYREAAFQITGGIHAREWQSPEVVTGIMERLVEERRDGGLYEYLVDSANLIVIPVLNIDGFRQTQRYPSLAILGTDPDYPEDSPRDGRMRRKNMRGADNQLNTLGDHLAGIDLNRNNPPFAPSGQASGNPDHLLYHGGAAQTEPETQALAQATNLGPAGRLRLYTDFHSFSAAFFDPLTGSPRQIEIQGRLINMARANLSSQGTSYSRRSTQTGFGGIGSTDEFFALQHRVPSWTLEIEPRLSQGGSQYGGFGVTHDGFILPDSEIARVRDELANAYALLFYAQAGPPSVTAARVLDEDGEVVWAGEWRRTSANSREFVTTTDGALQAGRDYRLWVAFDKPMRRRDDNGDITGYAGVSIEPAPGIRFDGLRQEIAINAGSGTWLSEPGGPDAPGYLRYRDDAYMAEFTVPASVDPEPGAALTLNIDAEDLAGSALDADPATVADWGDGFWTGYESADGGEGDDGGTDSTLGIPVSSVERDTVGFVTTQFEATEGSAITLTVRRDGSGEGRVAARIATNIIESDVVSSWTQHDIVWADGETGDRRLIVPVPDDQIVNDGFAFLLGLNGGILPLDGPAGRADSSFSVDIIDNDADGAGRLTLLHAPQPGEVTDPASGEPVELDEGRRLGLALCRAMRKAFDDGRDLRINLRDDAVYEFSQVSCLAQTLTAAIVGTDVSIAGHDAVIRLAQDAVGMERIFHVEPAGRLTLRGVSLEGGDVSGNLAGGAIVNEGTLLTNDVLFLANTANRGGALNNAGSATLTNTRFTANTARQGGGAIFSQGELELQGVTLADNATDGRGGAVFSQGVVAVTDSTFTGNDADAGSALASTGSGSIGNSIVDGDCSLGGAGALDSAGYNLVTGSGCGLSGIGDLAAADAGLEPVGADGLAPPAEGSPAIDAGDPDGCLAVDARGVPRPYGDTAPACDIGAAERGSPVHRGMWFNPQRSGHGIDLQQVGNVLILTWFTYGQDGNPVWYQAAGELTGAAWQADLLRYRHDLGMNAAEGELVGTVSLAFTSASMAEFGWDLSPVGQGVGSEPFEPLIVDNAATTFDATGHWAAADESGWGLTVDEQGGTNVTTVYYYDADGEARWAQGAGPSGLDIAIPVSSFTGFCPGCDLQAYPFTMTPAGTIELRFMSRLRAGAVSDIVYPGAAGGSWQREVELGTLSDPVP